ncbi:MAG: AAA family ATPase, partial [Candidatus Electrothrix sp. AR4]|nr:AAA family ATPase [Candidatus Electrothrix sp. AR4]
MLQRSTLHHLTTWQNKKTRKPLVIRGARQVGKSCLVRLFAEQTSLDLMEINLELNEDYIDCFTSKDPRQITALLELKA